MYWACDANAWPLFHHSKGCGEWRTRRKTVWLTSYLLFPASLLYFRWGSAFSWNAPNASRGNTIGICNTRRNCTGLEYRASWSLQKIDYLLSMPYVTKDDFTPWDNMHMVTITYLMHLQVVPLIPCSFLLHIFQLRVIVCGLSNLRIHTLFNCATSGYWEMYHRTTMPPSSKFQSFKRLQYCILKLQPNLQALWNAFFRDLVIGANGKGIWYITHV